MQFAGSKGTLRQLVKYERQFWRRGLPLARRFKSESVESPKTIQKSFDQIAKEMAARTKQMRKSPPAPKLDTDFETRRIQKEIYEPLAEGDLILMNLEPHIVLKTPKSPSGEYAFVNHVGMVREAPLSQVDCRLMPLIPPNTLRDNQSSLYAPDDTIGAELKVVTGDIEAYPLDKPAGKVVSWWVYRLISMPLRLIYHLASERARKILPSVLKTLESQQKDKEPTVLGFMTLVEMCTGCGQGQASVVDYYATRICLDHSSLQFKFQITMSYASTDAILLLSKHAEQCNLDAQHSRKPALEEFLIQEYARANLPLGPSEARAIEVLRKRFPAAKYIESGVAAELLKVEDRGLSENGWFSWMAATANSSSRTASLEQAVTEDIFANQRETFADPVFCIDSPNAKEVDDGISLQRVNGQTYRLGIHIANPSAFLNMKRALPHIMPLTTSVYLSNNVTIPMLPPKFIENSNLLSSSGGSKPALSFFCDFDIDSNRIKNIVIKPTTLTNFHNKISSSISRQEAPFGEYYDVALKLLQRRYDNGAISFQRYVNEPLDSILGTSTRPDGEVIVTEFMILANSLVAEYCYNHKIPVFYRRQFLQAPSPELKQKLAAHMEETGGMLGLTWRSVAQRGRTTLTPSSHAGIGVDITTRFTSPMRRLDDMVTHAQLEAHLLNQKLPFDTAALSELLDWMQLSQELATRYSRWDRQIEQFSQLKAGQEVDGIVLKSRASKSARLSMAVVYLPEYELFANFSGKPLAAEHRQKFVVSNVSPYGRFADVVLPPPTQSKL